MIFALIITALFLLYLIYMTRRVKKSNKEIDRRLTEHAPHEHRNRGVGDTAEETIRRERVFKIIKYVICYTFLGVLAIFMIVPFYWMIVTSLKTEAEIELAIPTFYPHILAFSNYPNAIRTLQAGRLILNTIVVGVFSTLGTLVTTVCAAFAFSRIKFKGREFIFTVFLATMMIPGEMMVISNYITISQFSKGNGTFISGLIHLGKDSYWSMIVPFLISVYYIYLLRQNFKQIPNELYYAAKVDGTSDIKYLLKIMLPIASPTLITISILKMMGAWNSYVWPMMITTQKSMRLITTGLRSAFTSEQGRTIQGQQMAGAAVVTAPLLFIFIFLRKYIMRGVGRSGIKG